MRLTGEREVLPLQDELRVALVSFDSLGDSLLYLTMVDNLRCNGFRPACVVAVVERLLAKASQ